VSVDSVVMIYDSASAVEIFVSASFVEATANIVADDPVVGCSTDSAVVVSTVVDRDSFFVDDALVTGPATGESEVVVNASSSKVVLEDTASVVVDGKVAKLEASVSSVVDGDAVVLAASASVVVDGNAVALATPTSVVVDGKAVVPAASASVHDNAVVLGACPSVVVVTASSVVVNSALVVVTASSVVVDTASFVVVASEVVVSAQTMYYDGKVTNLK
jgi:hypothetical protein